LRRDDGWRMEDERMGTLKWEPTVLLPSVNLVTFAGVMAVISNKIRRVH
jgi:hypothetical protein